MYSFQFQRVSALLCVDTASHFLFTFFSFWHFFLFLLSSAHLEYCAPNHILCLRRRYGCAASAMMVPWSERDEFRDLFAKRFTVFCTIHRNSFILTERRLNQRTAYRHISPCRMTVANEWRAGTTHFQAFPDLATNTFSMFGTCQNAKKECTKISCLFSAGLW